MSDQDETALGTARTRFLASLKARGRELRDLSLRLLAAPGEERAAEQLRRRLHALYASAQVFQERALLHTIEGVLARLDAARDGQRAPERHELEAVLALCDELGADSTSLPSSAPSMDNVSGLFRRELWHAPSPKTEPPSGSLPPVAIHHSVAGTWSAPDVVAVLVLARSELEREVRSALPAEHCELTSTDDPETAQVVIDQMAPDVVLVEAALLEQDGDGLVRRLRGARSGGVRSVIALVAKDAKDAEDLLAKTGVDAAIRLPLSRSSLLERLQRASGRATRSSSGLDALESATVDEIARSVGEEVRRGIADSLRVGRGERISLGDKSEIRAATWSAVARIRASLVERAAGRVRFDEAPFAGGPAALALTDDLAAAPYVAVAESLAGRRILVADDDPAVLWFFGGLLREAGAVVIEARDGHEALELARRRVPDLLISDILMPEIDGFTLCRELKRDLALSHVPVVLLSWKEDFLQRMRELDAGAAGYLRKEAGSHQILATAAEVLRPRAELTALLEGGDEVQGRVDALGVPALLKAVATDRPDARVSVRDAWNLFEVEIRDGSKFAVTRTASDGSFARGRTALRQLLGADVGRFGVVHSDVPVRGAFDEPLDKVLRDGVSELGAVLDAVSDNRLMRVQRLEFDDEVLAPLLTATPTALVEVAARLRAGESVKALVLGGSFTPRDLELHLRELARRGAIVGVRGADGEDLVELARRARAEAPGALLHGGERRGPVPSRPPVELATEDVEWIKSSPASIPPTPLHDEDLEWLPEPTPQGTPAPSRAPEPPPAARVSRLSPSEPGTALTNAAGFTVRSELLETASARTTIRPPGRSDAPSAPSSTVPFLLTLVGLAAIGFVGFRIAQPRLSAPKTTVHASPVREELQPTASTKSRTLPFIDRSRGVAVGPEQGLLIVEYEGTGQAPNVRVAGLNLGAAPVSVALASGRHQVTITRGDGQSSVLDVVVIAGQTRLVEARR